MVRWTSMVRWERKKRKQKNTLVRTGEVSVLADKVMPSRGDSVQQHTRACVSERGRRRGGRTAEILFFRGLLGD
jgi:hypothetical protein